LDSFVHALAKQSLSKKENKVNKGIENGGNGSRQ